MICLKIMFRISISQGCTTIQM